jgi:hypothetical protein
MRAFLLEFQGRQRAYVRNIYRSGFKCFHGAGIWSSGRFTVPMYRPTIDRRYGSDRRASQITAYLWSDSLLSLRTTPVTLIWSTSEGN